MSGETARGPRRVRAYLRSRRLRDRALRALNACFDGIWLGLLSREHLHLLDEAFYHDRREEIGGRSYAYTDEEYSSSGLADWETAAVEGHCRPGCRVVVTGAGSGREVLALLEMGFDALGYEPNPRFVAAGTELLERRGHEDRLRLCERDAFPAGADACDAVIVGWGSYMLIAGQSHRIEFLREARARLEDGDPILLSFFATRHKPRYFAIVVRIANVVRRVRGVEPAESGDTFVPNYAHYFTPQEVDEELRCGGFESVAFEAHPYAHAVGRAA